MDYHCSQFSSLQTNRTFHGRKLHVPRLAAATYRSNWIQPGPNAEYPCQICNSDVLDCHKGISCDNCLEWFHQLYISMCSDSYGRQANSSLQWMCKGCNTPNHLSSLYDPITSDQNQFSVISNLSGNINNNSTSSIVDPIATSSTKPTNKNINVLPQELEHWSSISKVSKTK